MIKISGGYTAINPNFVISNLPKGNEIDMDTAGILAVLKNILLRGVPTRPSAFLRNPAQIGEAERTNGEYWYVHSESLPNWTSVIKGGSKSNPARDIFWERFRADFPKESAWCLPECPLNQILSKDMTEDDQVDFYMPIYTKAIEVDGPQHKEPKQKKADQRRDRDIYAATSIYPIRIPVESLNDFDIKNDLGRFDVKGDGCLKTVDDISPTQKKYMFVFRAQMVLLHLLKQGVLPLGEEKIVLELKSNQENAKELFEVAAKDLFQWLEQLFVLANKEFKAPILVWNSGADLCIDIDLFSNYGQEDLLSQTAGTVRVRNDYFPYTRDAELKENFYAQSKNYYCVDCNDFRFENVSVASSQHKKALEFLLKNIFFFECFRPNQFEIVANGLSSKKGVIGLLPTGSGKSVCYQLVNLLTPGISIVVSPLKVLMDDQVRNLKQKLILNADCIHAEKRKIVELIKKNRLKLIYVTPERFFSEEFSGVVKTVSVGQIVLDEVHCLSEWGHDFRTSYLLLFGFFKELGWQKSVLLMGTTATGSPRVIEDVCCEFRGLKEQVELIAATSVKRHELTFEVIKLQYNDKSNQDKKNEVMKLVGTDRCKTLLFAVTKPETEVYYESIKSMENSPPCGFYHADAAADENNVSRRESKDQVFHNFASSRTTCLVATKAFGMGVDIPDIRQTIHTNLPSSVEALYQEMGRAGRDGNPAECKVLLWEYPQMRNKIEEAFAKPFSLELIRELHGMGRKLGDLKPQLYFLTEGNTTPEEGADWIVDVLYPYLKNKNEEDAWDLEDFVASCGLESDKLDDKIEKAMYKLYILGVIGLWRVTFKNGNLTTPIYSGIYLKDPDLETIQDNLCRHIRRYDYRYEYKGKKGLREFLTELYRWENEKFLAYRWESLKFLYRMLSEFKSSDDFADRIDRFFSSNEKLSIAVKENQNMMVWFDLLQTSDARVLKDQLARYLQEQSNAPHLQLMSSLVSLRNREFNEERKSRLAEALQMLKTDGFSFERIISESIDYLSTNQQDVQEFVLFLTDRFYLELKKMGAKKHLAKKISAEFLDEIEDRMQYKDILNVLQKLKGALGEQV